MALPIQLESRRESPSEFHRGVPFGDLTINADLLKQNETLAARLFDEKKERHAEAQLLENKNFTLSRDNHRLRKELSESQKKERALEDLLRTKEEQMKNLEKGHERNSKLIESAHKEIQALRTELGIERGRSEGLTEQLKKADHKMDLLMQQTQQLVKTQKNLLSRLHPVQQPVGENNVCIVDFFWKKGLEIWNQLEFPGDDFVKEYFK